MIQLHNTLTGKKEEFTPKRRGILASIGLGKPTVTIYHCGPTVYNYPHIGNLRAYVFADTLKRLMLASGFRVKQVINITDVGHLVSDADTGEDKMEKARRRESKSAWDIAKFYTDAFMSNLSDLNVDVTGTKFPRATQYIKEQISLIKTLERKGFTYKTSDGIYFDTSKFAGYGKLGNIDIAGLRAGARIGVDAEKRNLSDFALWKFSPAGEKAEKRDMEWPSPWGVGFPGWHIECSAMAASLLGTPVDIHTGGIDHIPVHHNNEIAQSEAAMSGDGEKESEKFVRFWLHAAFMNIEGGKMAKSADNFVTLATLKERGFSPLAYRYFLLGARYSTPMNFTWEALDAAATAYKRLVAAVRELPSRGGRVNAAAVDQALAYVADDLDTPKVLALYWDILKQDPASSLTLSPADKKATILAIDRLLGLNLGDAGDEKEKEVAVPENVKKLLDERQAARDSKDWAKSDALRAQIEALGFELKDTPGGQKIQSR